MGGAEDWTVITVTFNSRRDLDHYVAGPRFEKARWIVVDNASTDGSADAARAAGADVIVLDRNRGFATANNRGLAVAATPWVLFANPDVDVVEGDLPALARACSATGGLVAPQLLNDDRSVQRNGRGLPFLVDKFGHRGVRLPGARTTEYLPETWHAPTFVAWAIGAAVAGSRALVDELGGWDESFFLYYEDHDLGLRAWRHGIPVVVDPRVTWVHGWQRATMSASLTPWRREVASAIRFFRRYPELLLPTRRWAMRRHPAAYARSGTEVRGGE